jgi:cytoskeletal protein RodZ
MAQFGAELKQEREQKGSAIEDIVAATKVSSRHLIALEQERFKLLPGGVFNKGILRSYVRVVGLDEDAWMRRFVSAYEASGAAPAEDYREFAENIGRSRPARGRYGAAGLRWAGVAVLLAILGVAAYLVAGFVEKRVALETLPLPAHHAPGLALASRLPAAAPQRR